MNNTLAESLTHQFLSGGGEMGALMRAKDWNKTAIGPIEKWPQSLLTTLSIILNSKFPMFLFWGPESLCFYNDAYRPSLGEQGKHPAILGSRGEDYWQEIWEFIKPLIDNVMSGKEASWNEDQLLPIFRNNKLEDVYWTFSYSPVKGETGDIAGVFVTCSETTGKVQALKQLEISKNTFKDAIMQAPVAICIFRGPRYVVETANRKMLELWGKSAEQVLGKTIFTGVPESAGQGFEQILENVYQTGVTFSANGVPVKLARGNSVEQVFVNFIYEPCHETDGTISGITAVAIDVTDEILAKERLEESESQFRDLIAQSPIAMTIFRGRDLIIDVFNEAMLTNLWRREAHEVRGKKLTDAFPELKDQKYPELLLEIFNTGKGFKENETAAIVDSHDGRRTFYLDCDYSPVFDADKTVSGVMVTVSDVTEKVEARQKINDAAERLQLATEGTQLATWDLDLVMGEIIYSARLNELFGHKDPAIKMSHVDMRAQIHPDDRTSIVEKAFDVAMKNGIYEYEARVIHPDTSVHWIRTLGKVVFDDQNKPMRMLGTMMDITDYKKAEENTLKLAAIVQSSDDAIISKTLEGVVMSWNDSAKRIFGYEAEEIIGQSVTKLIPKDRLNEEPQILQRLKSGERVDHFETQRVHKDGSLLDLSLTISPIRDYNGILIGASKIARDITFQKQAERLIAENEERLKIVLEASELGTWELNVQTNELTYSDRYAEMTGFKEKKNVPYQEIAKHLHPDDLALRKRAFEVAYKSGVLNYETRVVWEDGSTHWIEAKGKVFYDEHNKPFKIVGTSRDFTAEQLSKQKIEESERRFKTVTDTAPVMIWMAGTDKSFNFLNKAWLEFSGHTAEQEYGSGWMHCIYPADYDRCLDIYNSNFDARKEFYMEFRLKKHNGEYRWVSDIGTPRFAPDGSFEGYIGACMDIHDRIIFEEKLKESETRFRSVANSAPVMIWMTDLEQKAIFLNKCWSDFTGLSLKEGLGSGWTFIVHPDDLKATSAEFGKAYQDRTEYNMELRIKRNDGKYRWVQDHAVPRYDIEGEFLGYIGSSVDIHEQKFAKKELENRVEERTADLLELNNQLIKTNHELEQFAYVSSHDLQEPLRKIQTFSEMLSTSMKSDEKSVQYLGKINASALRMSNLIKDLLSYSRLSKTDERFVKTDLNEVLQNIRNDFELLIQQKEAMIISANLPEINAIPVQINQLFYNLVSNSLKFSETKPVIRISSELLSKEDQKNIPQLEPGYQYSHITFEDNGIGFSQAHADQIFVIFQRLNDRQKYSGTGIGLAMCKKIVENHHGFISATGKPGKGALFNIYLPYQH